MANRFSPGDAVTINDGSEATKIWTEDGLVFDVDVPDGTRGIVANVLRGGNIYTVQFPIEHLGRKWNAAALFIEAHLN